MRHSTVFFTLLSIGCLLFCALLFHARHQRLASAASLEARKELAGMLQLTDLCLFTEARYTRHPAMADLHTPFQDHPLALDHFPSGSLVSPTWVRH